MLWTRLLLPVYVSHAKFLTDRVPFLEAQLRSIGLNFEWVDVFDPEDLPAVVENKFFRPGHGLSHAQMSNCLKHVTALQRVAASGKTSLILEDDIAFASDARQKLEACLSEFPDDEPAVAYISCGDNWYTPAKLQKPGQSLYSASRCRTTDAYLITGSAARARLDWIEKFRIPTTTGHTFNLTDPECGIRILWAEPPFVVQQSLTGVMRSAISDKRMSRSRWHIAGQFYFKKLTRHYLDRWLKIR